MNICTCVLYHEVLVYGVRHIRKWLTTRVASRRMHECGRTCIQISIRGLHDRDPLELSSRLSAPPPTPSNLSRGGSVLLSKGLVVIELIVKFLSFIYARARANHDSRLWMAFPTLPIGNGLTSIAIRQSRTIANFFWFFFLFLLFLRLFGIFTSLRDT